MKKVKNDKLNKNGERLDMILKEIFRLEKKMDAGFGSLHNNFNQLQGSVDAYAKKADTYFQEMTMLARKVDRHEKWIQQIAEKLGVKLHS